MSHYHLELVRKLNLFHFVLLNKKNNLEKTSHGWNPQLVGVKPVGYLQARYSCCTGTLIYSAQSKLPTNENKKSSP